MKWFICFVLIVSLVFILGSCQKSNIGAIPTPTDIEKPLSTETPNTTKTISEDTPTEIKFPEPSIKTLIFKGELPEKLNSDTRFHAIDAYDISIGRLYALTDGSDTFSVYGQRTPGEAAWGYREFKDDGIFLNEDLEHAVSNMPPFGDSPLIDNEIKPEDFFIVISSFGENSKLVAYARLSDVNGLPSEIEYITTKGYWKNEEAYRNQICVLPVYVTKSDKEYYFISMTYVETLIPVNELSEEIKSFYYVSDTTGIPTDKAGLILFTVNSWENIENNTERFTYEINLIDFIKFED